MAIHEEKREIERHQLDDRTYKLMKIMIFGTLGIFAVYFGLIIWLISQR